MSALASLAGLAILAALLPGPIAWPAALAGEAPGGGTANVPGSTAESALLLAAGVLVWALLGWAMVVLCIAAVGRLPGTPGQIGRSLLRRIAPAAAGRLLVATVGVSLLAGTSACAGPMTAGAMASSTDASTGSTTLQTDPTPVLPSGAGGSPTIDLDWPAVESPAPSTAAAADPPASLGAATTTPPPQPPDPTATVGATETVDPTATNSPTDTLSTHPTDPPGTAQPDPTGTAQPDPTGTAQPDPTGTAQPDPPDTAPTDDAALPDRQTATGPVTVRPGDTLWSIAAAALPPSSSAAQIDATWREWYRINQRVIGADPDLILPGQTLLPPASDPVGSP